MKISKSLLRQIIKEELQAVLFEDELADCRAKAVWKWQNDCKAKGGNQKECGGDAYYEELPKEYQTCDKDDPFKRPIKKSTYLPKEP